MGSEEISENLRYALKQAKDVEWRGEAAYVNGVFVAGRHGNSVALHLKRADREDAMEMGSTIAESGPGAGHVVLPEDAARDYDCLAQWLKYAVSFARKQGAPPAAKRAGPTAGNVLGAFGKFAGQPCTGTLQRHGQKGRVNLFLFDPETVPADELSAFLSDTFGDGYEPGFVKKEKRTWRWCHPRLRLFAVATGSSFEPGAALSDLDDVEHLLLSDVETGEIHAIDVDGTAVQKSPYPVGKSLAALKLKAGEVDEA